MQLDDELSKLDVQQSVGEERFLQHAGGSMGLSNVP